MFQTLARKVVFSLAALAACAGLVAAWRCGEEPTAVKLPAPVSHGSGTIVDDQFYAVTDTGRLLKVDLKSGKLADLGAPADKLSPFVDVAGDYALVAAPAKAHLVDLRSGKVVSTTPFRGEAVHGLGLIGRRAFVHTGPAVVILDLEAGTMLHTIDLGPVPANDYKSGVHRLACQRAGKRLYVSNDSDKGLAIIDLETGKLLDQVKVPAWRIGSVHVTGDTATLIGLRYGYGVWTNSIAQVDLKTKEYTPKKLITSALWPCRIIQGPGNSILLAEASRAFRYEADGTLTPILAKENSGRLVGMWNGSALVVRNGPQAGGQELAIVPLPPSRTRATTK